MNKHLILSALFVTSLGFSIGYAHNEVEKNGRSVVIEVIDNNKTSSAPEITIIQGFTDELEKKLVDITSEADLKALVAETKELVSYMDELEETFDAELLKLALLGAVEGLVTPVVWAAYKGTFSFNDPTAVPFIIGIITNAIVKAAGGRAGLLPKIKLSDVTTPVEIIKSILGCGASIGIFIGLYALINEIEKNMNGDLVSQSHSLKGLLYSAPALANALPSLITVLSKRIEKRNAVKHVIAHLRGH